MVEDAYKDESRQRPYSRDSLLSHTPKIYHSAEMPGKTFRTNVMQPDKHAEANLAVCAPKARDGMSSTVSTGVETTC